MAGRSGRTGRRGAAALLWWALRRNSAAAVTGAFAVMVVIGSVSGRVPVIPSHLVAMVSSEIVLVLVPLPVVSALPDLRGAALDRVEGHRRSGWTWWAVGCAVTYSALLIAIHQPGVRHRGAALGSVPLCWLR